MFWPLPQVPPGYEEVDGLSTSEGNSVKWHERVHAVVRLYTLTFIAGSPKFCCRKVGICTGFFREVATLKRASVLMVISSG
jgi:ribosomal protein S14